MTNATPKPRVEPEVPASAPHRALFLRRTYNMSLEDYDDLLRSQGSRCAICRKAPPPGRCLAVDHNHRTGVIRGLLCSPCNTGLGSFQDRPDMLERALDYLYADPMWQRFAKNQGRG